MSRIEPNADEQNKSNEDSERQQPADRGAAPRTPSKAEGDEQTIDEALRNEQKKD